MWMDTSPRSLTWSEADPARHPFDADDFPLVLRTLGPASRTPAHPGTRYGDPGYEDWTEAADLWADAMSVALSEHYGRWTTGWRWGPGESDFDGGPVGAWCCANHTMAADPAETLAKVTAAVLEWRIWLERLRDRFDAHPLDLADLDDQRVLWEDTARTLIRHVAEATAGGSGWYAHCDQVLTWFLEHHGVDPDRSAALAAAAVGGRFHSWAEPDPALITDVAERLSTLLTPDDRARPAPGPDAPPPDHLQAWLALRLTIAWPTPPQPLAAAEHEGAPEDALPRDIRLFDAVIDPARGAGLQTALDLALADAARGARLDFALLQTWQQHVLASPEPPPFRTVPAFAKAGRERYGIAPDTPARFDACLAESAAASELPLSVRAARAFLDVCFFHPFADGNARCAVLTAAFVLAREGYAVTWARALRTFAIGVDAGDATFLANRIGFGMAPLTVAG